MNFIGKTFSAGAIILSSMSASFAEMVPLDWSISGPGVTEASEGSEGQWSLSYGATQAYDGVWEVSATAAEGGDYEFNWDLFVFHSWNLPTLKFSSVINGVETIIYDGEASNASRSHFGTSSFAGLNTGDLIGYKIEGSHYDTAQRLEGTLNLVQSGYESTPEPRPDTSVPLPASGALLALALAGFGFRRNQG